MSINDQSTGKARFGRLLVDAIELVREALKYIKDKKLRAEIERYLSGGEFPSDEALEALEAAILTVMMMRRQK